MKENLNIGRMPREDSFNQFICGNTASNLSVCKGMNMNKEEKNLETSFLELNEIISKLEMEEVSLEDSFSLYQEGMKLLKVCNDSIDKVEKQIIILGENNAGDNGEKV
ncbi:MAG: exodeoxyribonuclease VII small subunit [Anaerocolumna sp.]